MDWTNGLADEMADAARALVDAAGRAGLQPRVTSTFRTYSEQARLYRRFLAGQSGYPVAPPGSSAHENRGDGTCEAFDMVVTPMEALADVGYTWQDWGGGWNGADAIHFQLPGASERAKQRGGGQADDTDYGSGIAKFINNWFLTVGPWFSPLTGASLIKGAVRVEKALGFNAALDWFYRHVMTEVK